MRTRPILCLILGWTLILTLSASAQWQTISEGIDYREYTLSGPRRVFVTRMDRANTSCIIDSCIARETLFRAGNRQPEWRTVTRTPSGMGPNLGHALRSGGGHPWRGFTSDQPTNGQVISGWYAKRFNEFSTTALSGRSTVPSLIGDYIYHPSNKKFHLLSGHGADAKHLGGSIARGGL
jgi:hypothetical protein